MYAWHLPAMEQAEKGRKRTETTREKSSKTIEKRIEKIRGTVGTKGHRCKPVPKAHLPWDDWETDSIDGCRA